MRSDIGWCDNTMFVRIHEELEVSEQAQFRPIPSTIRLKTFDFIVRPGDYRLKSTPLSPLEGPIRRVIEKGESNGSFLLRREFKRPLFLDHVLHGKRPCNVVEGSPEIRNNIPDNKAPRLCPQGRVKFNVNDTESLKKSLRYGLFPDGMLCGSNKRSTLRLRALMCIFARLVLSLALLSVCITRILHGGLHHNQGQVAMNCHLPDTSHPYVV